LPATLQAGHAAQRHVVSLYEMTKDLFLALPRQVFKKGLFGDQLDNKATDHLKQEHHPPYP